MAEDQMPPPPPPPSVVGYGRRLYGGGPGAAAPASILQPQSGGRPLPYGMPPPGSTPAGYVPAGYPAIAACAPASGLYPTRRQFDRTFPFTIAQLLGLVQGVLALLGAISLFQAASMFNQLGAMGAPISVDTPLTGYALWVLAVAVLLILGSALASRVPLLRWLIVVWELIAVAFAIGVLVEFGSLLNLRDAFIVLAYGSGLEYVHPLISLLLAAGVIYGLVVHSAVRAAFAPR